VEKPWGGTTAQNVKKKKQLPCCCRRRLQKQNLDGRAGQPCRAAAPPKRRFLGGSRKACWTVTGRNLGQMLAARLPVNEGRMVCSRALPKRTNCLFQPRTAEKNRETWPVVKQRPGTVRSNNSSVSPAAWRLKKREKKREGQTVVLKSAPYAFIASRPSQPICSPKRMGITLRNIMSAKSSVRFRGKNFWEPVVRLLMERRVHWWRLGRQFFSLFAGHY